MRPRWRLVALLLGAVIVALVGGLPSSSTPAMSPGADDVEMIEIPAGPS